MEEKKLMEMTVSELNDELSGMGFLEKVVEKNTVVVLNSIGINVGNPEEVKEVREDLYFLREVRLFMKKILSATLTGFLWVSGLSVLYTIIDKHLWSK